MRKAPAKDPRRPIVPPAGRMALAISIASLVLACSRQARDTTPTTSAADRAAYLSYSACASEVRRLNRVLVPPEAPVRPPTSRRQAPQEWARYDRDLARYNDEYRRYATELRILQDKIASRCGTPGNPR